MILNLSCNTLNPPSFACLKLPIYTLSGFVRGFWTVDGHPIFRAKGALFTTESKRLYLESLSVAKFLSRYPAHHFPPSDQSQDPT